jgi:3-hydroxyacyl-CoA dehydrogenase
MDTVGIVGAGFMGPGIAESTTVAGLRALVYESEAAPLERSRERVAASLDRAVSRGKLEPDAATDALQRATFTTELVDLLGCDLVIEAVTEDEWIKSDGMKLGCGHPMGPLALCDFIGLDVIEGICASLYEEHKRDEYAAPPLLRRMVASGHLGSKTGHGFYEYSAVLAGSGARS